MPDLKPLHPAAVGFTALRVLKDGRGRQYSAVEFTRGWAGADHYRRKCRACGWLTNGDDGTEAYALLDAIDANGDIVDTYDVRDAAAWRHIKKDLKLTVTYTDGDPEPRPAKVEG